MDGRFGPISLFVFVHLTAFFAAGHAICFKRDARAALGWVLFILLVPLIGTLVYLWIGVNRIRRRKRKVKNRPLRAGNALRLLVNGDEAYPRMLRAIAEAKCSISLVSYIFDNDLVGREFAEALCVAGERGVEVRVLVDAVGARYSFPSIFRCLHAKNLRAARFLETILPWRFHYSQLRNHRKALVVDGVLGFTGGMNIRRAHLVSRADHDATQDLHFQVEGPVVEDLQRVFAEDWEFATREQLSGPAWFPAISARPEGASCVRVVSDGPDEGFDVLRWTILGALSAAKETVQILTPYFVPDQALITVIGLAAMRGVRVEILLPDHSNVFLVQWASRALLWQVLERGCQVFVTPRPFDHSKMLIVDGEWALVGSANWDARSLRLNFEMDLEIHDKAFALILQSEFQRKRALARPVTLQDVDARPLWMRLRDGSARLLSPYL